MTDYPLEVPITETQVGFVQSYDDVQEFMRWLSLDRDVLAVDSETGGADSLNAFNPLSKIRLVQFGDCNSGWAIDNERWPGLVRHVMEVYTGHLALHNAAFDLKWFMVQYPGMKIPWSRITDTMLLARIDHTLSSAGLKPLSDKFFGSVATVGQKMLEATMENTKTNWSTVPLEAPAYSTYSALDVVLTARLYRRLKHLKTGPTARVVDLEHHVRRIATGMEVRGFRVDRPYCEQKLETLDEFVTNTKKYCLDKFHVSIGSSAQLGKWFEDEGVELTERTGTGAPKMDADVLEGLSHTYELADLALKSRKADKIRGTYFENILKFSESDGKVHCDINTVQAATGRMSITKPALQTLPATGEGAAVRKAFLPTEGNVIYSADYSSIEARLTAHFGTDSAMKAAFTKVDNEGGDFFTILGTGIFGPSFNKADPRRRLVKSVMYAAAYGAGVKRMAITAGVPEHEMRTVANAMFETYPSIKGAAELAATEAQSNLDNEGSCYVTTPYGRKLPVDADYMYKAGNYRTQGHAAEVLKTAMVNLDFAGLGEYLTLPVHDELVFDVPEDLNPTDFINEVKDNMQMTEEMGYYVPLPVAPEGPHDRWGMADK